MKRFLPILFLVNFLFFTSTAQIDLKWLSYFGGTMTNLSTVHYDPIEKCIYVVGNSGDSTNIATPGSFKDQFHQSYNIPNTTAGREADAILSKWDLEGNLIWSTYFGGSKMEHSARVKTDLWGNVYILGTTESDTGIASSGAYLGDFERFSHYLAKFNPAGERLWSTYLSISDTMTINGNLQTGQIFVNNVYKYQLDIDDSGNVYAGFTAHIEKEIGTAGTHKPERNQPEMMFGQIYYLGDVALVKFDSNGTKLWGTYYGGGNIEYLIDLYASKDGSVYLLGSTNSDTGIASSGTYQSAHPGNGYECNFLAKFNGNGQREWGTYICSPGSFLPSAITGDEVGNVYVTGFTSSTQEISTPGVYQENRKGDQDIFIMKFDGVGQKSWGTYLGGYGYNQIGPSMWMAGPPYIYSADFIAAGSIVYVSSEDALYVGGSTTDTAGWNVSCGYSTHFGNAGFLAKLNTSGQMVWTSHFDNQIYDIAVAPQQNDGKNAIYFIGGTLFDSLTTPGAQFEQKTSPYAGYIGKFEEDICGHDTLNLIYDQGFLQTDTGYSVYHWYHNGVLMLTNTSAVFQVSDTTGSYSVVAENCGCLYSSKPFVFSPTSISEVATDGPLSLFPNPTEDKLTISFSGIEQTPFLVSIMDLSGRILYQKKYEIGKEQKVADITSLHSGVYFLKVTAGNLILVGKFVKR